MPNRKLSILAAVVLHNIIYALFLTFASIETLTAHVFLQTLGKYFLILSLNLLAVPLIVLWLPPWWAIYVTVLNWLGQMIFYYRLHEDEEREKEW